MPASKRLLQTLFIETQSKPKDMVALHPHLYPVIGTYPAFQANIIVAHPTALLAKHKESSKSLPRSTSPSTPLHQTSSQLVRDTEITSKTTPCLCPTQGASRFSTTDLVLLPHPCCLTKPAALVVQSSHPLSSVGTLFQQYSS